MKRIEFPLNIFLIGATGDLAKRKILPAIYNLYQKKILPTQFRLIGVARRKMNKEQFEQYAYQIIQPAKTDEQWRQFCKSMFFVSGDVADLQTFVQLRKFHSHLDQCGNHLWYVATLPNLYLDVIRNIKQTSLEKVACGWTKFLLEKPFGTDLTSSQTLNKELLQVFAEEQIYRIDHFLAKETIQNLMVFRFGNGIFEHLWNRHHIDHIQIIASEKVGINGRANFYDAIGVVRDVVQNHILQMLAMSLMEEPAGLDSKTIHAHRMQFLSQLEIISAHQIKKRVVFGQYASGEIDGQLVKGYRQEDNGLEHSNTPTAIAAKLLVNSPRWQGTPIYLRAGKRLSQAVTEINIQFKEPLNAMFKNQGISQQSNVLTLRIQPNEGVVLRMNVKQPGLQLEMKQVPMQFCYKTEFQMGLVEAYEKLIYDAAQGDPTLFPQANDIDASWRIVQPLLDYLQETNLQPDLYPAGSWGSDSFQKLIANDGRQWLQPSPHVCNL